MSKIQSALTKEEFSETMTDLFSYLQENMATKDDLKNGLDGLRTELTGKIEDLRTEMHARFEILERELVDIR